MRTVTAILAVIVSLVTATARADIYFGYVGIASETGNNVPQVEADGIHPRVAGISFPETWTAVPYGSYVTNFQSQTTKVQAIPFLDQVLFREYTSPSSPCIDYTTNTHVFYGLRANWQARLANFVSTNGAYITAATTKFIVVHPEVNNGCVPLTDVDTAAQAVHAAFPGIPVTMGYGFDRNLGQPAPAYIPASIDRVGFWNYGQYDPSVPSNVCNADNQYLVRYNHLVSLLNANQKIVLVPDAFWETGLHDQMTCGGQYPAGWPKWFLGPVAQNYETFALAHTDKVDGMLMFLWGSAPNIIGTVDLPSSVRTIHAQIAARH